MIANLTQHASSPEQQRAGVFDLEGDALATLREALTFSSLPPPWRVRQRAQDIAALAASSGAKHAMIGGAPYLMAPLEAALRERGVEPLYAFSRRESVEEVQPDGSVEKRQVFRHLGFVQAA